MLIRDFVNKLSTHECLEIIREYEQYEKSIPLHNSFLREAALKLISLTKNEGANVNTWMDLIAQEIFRRFAYDHPSVKQPINWIRDEDC